MLNGFEKIVEERIREAQKKGELDHLPGSGRPFFLENEPRVPEELRLAYKILKNAGFNPPEIELKKKIRQTEDLFSRMAETAEKYRVLKKLNFLVLKLNSMRNGSTQLDFPQQYSEKLVNNFSQHARIDPKGW
ncbi:MAG: DnaJ family domain-containing protein [Desulfobacterales bacterium]